MSAVAWATALATAALPLQAAGPSFALGTREIVFLSLWALLSLLFWLQYRRSEGLLPAALKVGGLLAFIWALMTGFDWTLEIVPAEQVFTFGEAATADGPRVPLMQDAVVWLVLLLVVMVAWHVRRKFGTVLSLLLSTWDRGHWYMLPVLFILMTLGLLLVAAAASPVLSPFIYTLF